MPNPNPNTSGLIPAKNGEIRNPKGRPKGKSISTILKELLTQGIPPQVLKSDAFKKLGIGENLTTAELIALMNVLAVFYKFNPTQLRAIEMIQDRTEGKPLQKQEIKMEGEVPILNITFDGESICLKDDQPTYTELPPEPAI